MKKRILVLLLIFSSVLCYSQEKLFWDLYYWLNPKHEIASYNKIMLVSNASNESKSNMRRYAKKTNYDVVLYDDLFPPYRTWSPKEVDSIIIAEKFDALLTINIKGIQTYQTSFGSTSFFQISNNSTLPIALSNSTTKTKVGSTQMEIFLVDGNTAKNEYVIYITGSVGGKPMNAAFKSMYDLLLKFEELGISYQPPKKDRK